MPSHRKPQSLARLFWLAGLAIGIAGGALVAVTLASAGEPQESVYRQPNASAMM